MNWYKKHLYAWTAKATYTLNELLYKLKLFGVVFYKKGKGDHDIYINTNNNMTSAVPTGAGGRTIASETLTHKILPELGIPWNIWSSIGKRPKKRDVARLQDQLPWNQKETIEPEPETEPEIPDWQRGKWYQQQRQLTSAVNFNLSKKKDKEYDPKQLERGTQVELEHNNSKEIAKSITKDHLGEFSNYYKKLEEMESKLEDTKDAKGLYNQPQGDEYNQQAGDEIINDWEMANREELKKMKAFAKQKRFENMKIYGEQLVQQGYSRLLVEKIMTAAMYGVRL